MQAYILIDSLIFVPAFPLWRVSGAAAPRGPATPHDQQQSHIVLLAPHQDGTMKVGICNCASWSLDKLWPLSRGCRL